MQPAAHLLDLVEVHHAAQLLPHVLQNVFRILVAVHPISDETEEFATVLLDGFENILLNGCRQSGDENRFWQGRRIKHDFTLNAPGSPLASFSVKLMWWFHAQ